MSLQEFDPDVLVGDVAYACALGQSEILRRGEGRGRLPRVMVSALPILDPLVPGRMENMPNNLAYIPQMGTSLSNRMVSQPHSNAADPMHVFPQGQQAYSHAAALQDLVANSSGRCRHGIYSLLDFQQFCHLRSEARKVRNEHEEHSYVLKLAKAIASPTENTGAAAKRSAFL